MATPVDLERAIEDAVEVLKSRRLTSVIAAFKFSGGVGSFSALVMGAIAACGGFSVGVLVALGSVTVMSWPIAFAIMEFGRLALQTNALREVTRTQKDYDLLLTQARRERDEAKADGDSLRAERTLLLAGTQLAQLIAAGAKKQEDSDE
jgi:hypothetical protein